MLRHVSAAFAEDPLRVLRAARFMARFAARGFHVAPETQALMRETTTLLDGLQKHWLLRKYMGSDDALRSEEVLVP